MLIAFHKPYGVLSQFTSDAPGQRTLAEFGFPSQVYAVGRLDLDSEGLLILSDERALNHKLLDPKNAHWRRYYAQVEGRSTEAQLEALRRGVKLSDWNTRPARAWALASEPPFAPRNPPIRVRQTIPTTWIALELREGKNRQVRRMSAAVGLPTLRLVRVSIGKYELPPDLLSGQWRQLDEPARAQLFSTER